MKIIQKLSCSKSTIGSYTTVYFNENPTVFITIVNLYYSTKYYSILQSMQFSSCSKNTTISHTTEYCNENIYYSICPIVNSTTETYINDNPTVLF